MQYFQIMFKDAAGVSPFIKRSLPYSTIFCLNEADRRSEFKSSSRFWFFFRHKKEQENRQIDTFFP